MYKRQLESLFVSEGDEVRAGDVLARLDDSKVTDAAAQAKESMESARSAMESARVARDEAQARYDSAEIVNPDQQKEEAKKALDEATGRRDAKQKELDEVNAACEPERRAVDEAAKRVEASRAAADKAREEYQKSLEDSVSGNVIPEKRQAWQDAESIWAVSYTHLVVSSVLFFVYVLFSAFLFSYISSSGLAKIHDELENTIAANDANLYSRLVDLEELLTGICYRNTDVNELKYSENETQKVHSIVNLQNFLKNCLKGFSFIDGCFLYFVEEEIYVPASSTQMAAQIAERIRRDIVDHPFFADEASLESSNWEIVQVDGSWCATKRCV